MTNRRYATIRIVSLQRVSSTLFVFEGKGIPWTGDEIFTSRDARCKPQGLQSPVALQYANDHRGRWPYLNICQLLTLCNSTRYRLETGLARRQRRVNGFEIN